MHVYVVCVWWNLHHTDSFEAQIWRVSDGERAANHMRAPVHFWGHEERGASSRSCSADAGFYDDPRPCTTSNGLITLQDGEKNVKTSVLGLNEGM